jgi:hypothetical protein
MFVTPSGLWLTRCLCVLIGLHPILMFVAPSGLWLNSLPLRVDRASPYSDVCHPFGAMANSLSWPLFLFASRNTPKALPLTQSYKYQEQLSGYWRIVRG